jgi:nicotinamide riboside transporter PnuC
MRADGHGFWQVSSGCGQDIRAYLANTMEALWKFHGSDWVGMVFGLVSTYFLAKKNRWGFVLGVIGGFGWVAFGILTGSIPSIVANTLFIAFNCRGFFRWKKDDEEDACAPRSKRCAST